MNKAGRGRPKSNTNTVTINELVVGTCQLRLTITIMKSVILRLLILLLEQN